MGSGDIPFPRPPDLDPEVQSLLSEQKLTLGQFRQYLDDDRIQSKETQDLLKGVSPLYDKKLTKKGAPASKGSQVVFNQDRADSIRANINRYKNVGLTQASPDEIPRWVLDELARQGYDSSRTMAQHNEHGKGGEKDPAKIFDNILLTVKQGYGLDKNGVATTDKDPYGLLTQKEVDVAATDDEYSTTLNQGKLTELKAQIAKNLEFEEATNQEVNKYISEYLELSHLGAERQKKAYEGTLPVSEGLRLRKEEDYKTLQESGARSGNAIYGNNPGGAMSLSSAGNERIGQFNRTYGLLEDAERHGEIAQGASRTNMDFGNNRSLQTSPYQQLGMLPQANQNYAAMYPSLMGMQSNMMQPYMQQSQMQYGGLLQKYQQQMQNQQGMYQLYGMGAGALIGGMS